jgi:hypothetical protein
LQTIKRLAVLNCKLLLGSVEKEMGTVVGWLGVDSGVAFGLLDLENFSSEYII